MAGWHDESHVAVGAMARTAGPHRCRGLGGFVAAKLLATTAGVWLLGCGSQTGDADRARDPAGFRVATFNVHDLFDDRAPTGAAGDSSFEIQDSEQYEQHLWGVARIIELLQAQVVVLQEVEDRLALEDLASMLDDPPPHALLQEGNDPRGIDVAVLSWLSVFRVESHREEWFGRLDIPDGPSYRYARDCLEVHLEPGGGHVVLLAVHFKSKRDDDPDWRLAEAQHTRRLAEQLRSSDPEVEVLIAGDFNDVPGSEPMDAILGLPSACACSGPEFTSAGQSLPPEQRYTTVSWSQPGGVALHDDLVVGPRLRPVLDAASVQVLHDAELPEELREVSDHAPLAADFEWPLR